MRLEPVRTLLSRIEAELGEFGAPGQPIRVSRAPGRLDVMGGIADYTGSLVCEATLDCGAAVAIASRADAVVQIFSFNLFDEHLPFTLRIPLAALATQPLEVLSAEFNQAGRKWAGYLAGCLTVLHRGGWVDLLGGRQTGMDIALYSTIPQGAGVSSSAAIEVATMVNLRDHFQIAGMDPMGLAALCQRVENEVVGAACGIMDQATSCAGRAGSLLKLKCQPHEIEGYLTLPEDLAVVGVNTGVRHNVASGAGSVNQYTTTRTAAFMGHRVVLAKMAEMGRAAGRELIADPMRGYLANLALDDYKTFFRQYVPAQMTGEAFLGEFGATVDTVTRPEAGVTYAVQKATDHHVFEAHRVRNFVRFLEEAAGLAAGEAARGLLLNKAGHLMYASHHAYTHDALLGSAEADWVVNAVRANEAAGLFGAKITGAGQGGTVAILAERTERAEEAIERIAREYGAVWGREAGVLRVGDGAGSGAGAWETGTVEVART